MIKRHLTGQNIMMTSGMVHDDTITLSLRCNFKFSDSKEMQSCIWKRNVSSRLFSNILISLNNRWWWKIEEEEWEGRMYLIMVLWLAHLIHSNQNHASDELQRKSQRYSDLNNTENVCVIFRSCTKWTPTKKTTT